MTALVSGTHEYLLTPNNAFYNIGQAQYTLNVFTTDVATGYSAVVLVNSAAQTTVDESKVVLATAKTTVRAGQTGLFKF